MSRFFVTTYVRKFEREVIIPGIEQQLFGKIQDVALRRGRLAKTKFGLALGGVIETDLNLVIDYYGYCKKSKGFLDFVREVRHGYKGQQIRKVSATVIYFQSIRIEDVARLSQGDVISGFPQFKHDLIKLREFSNTKGKDING